jgi:hypothetical protein
MLLAPTSMWAQAALSPRTAVVLSNTNEQKAHYAGRKHDIIGSQSGAASALSARGRILVSGNKHYIIQIM